MFKNYLKIAWRNLLRNKIFTLINIVGLSVSLSVAIVIYLIVDYHFSFDRFHKDKDRIYRVVTTSYFSGEEFPNSGVPVPLSEVIKTDIKGIDETVFFHTLYVNQVEILKSESEKTVFHEGSPYTIFTDPNYFSFFEYEWLAGSKETLNEPFNQVLTEKAAKKYFGEHADYESIIGKKINYNNTVPISISGIVKDLDQPTEFTFQAFISLPTLKTSPFTFYNAWDGITSNDQLIVKINDNITPQQIESQFPKILKKYLEDDEYSQRTHNLQPIEDIHFNGKFSNYNSPPAHKPTLYGLLLVTIFLLLLGCINFINLTTSLASVRTKEISVRKTLGGFRSQLVGQFYTETFVVVLLSTLLSLILVPTVFDIFGEFIPKQLTIQEFWRPETLAFLALLTITIGLLSGIFPASAFMRLKPALLFKRASASTLGKKGPRQVLIVAQFSISLFLMLATFFINKQVQYSINKELGYQTEAIITFSVPNSNEEEVFLDKIRKIPEVEKACTAGPPPASYSTYSSTFNYEQEEKSIEIHADIKDGETSYLKLYDIQLLAGRGLHSSDSGKACLINETYLKTLGFSNPSEVLGDFFELDDKKIMIVGVVDDFHLKSTHLPIKPLMIQARPENYNHFHVKYSKNNGESWLAGIEKIKTIWNEIYPDKDFKYQFFDDQVAGFYRSEKNIARLLGWASGLTILISCLGLLGLAVFTANQRTKEIGIRKVNGAKVWEVMTMLNKDFVKWVAGAFVITTPVAWFAMNKWLENFAYRTELSWWVFALAGVLALGIALLTVSWQSWRAATRNPVEALRYE